MKDTMHRRNRKKKGQISSYTVKKKDTLLANLIASFPDKSRRSIKAVLRDRQVSVEEKPVTQFDYVVIPGQDIVVNWEPLKLVKLPGALNIVHMDQDLIIIDKPSGLLTIATAKEKRKTAYSMLSELVKTEDPDNKIFVIHRLDRETSGLLMFARSERVKHHIQDTWNSTISDRTYVGIVEGVVEPATGTITSWLQESSAFTVYSSQNERHGKKAITHYQKIEDNGTVSLLQINLETGRKHQIRVHMQDLEHPIVGDKKYGSGGKHLGRMALHAMILEFTHPTSGKSCHFDTGIPKKFLQFIHPRKTSAPVKKRRQR